MRHVTHLHESSLTIQTHLHQVKARSLHAAPAATVRDMAHSYVRHDSFTCNSPAAPAAGVLHDPFICVT